MNIIVLGRKITITDSLREYAEEKIGSAVKAFDIADANVEVLLRHEKAHTYPNIAEVTIRLKGHTLRASEAADTMQAAIDMVSETTNRQIRKYKTKVVDRHRRPHSVDIVKDYAAHIAVPAEKEEDDDLLVRVKYVDLGAPMSDEDALVEIDLVGHDFFVYVAEDTGLVNVAYKRNDGAYGIIKPKVEDNPESL